MLLRRTQLIGNWRAKRLAAGLAAVFILLISNAVIASPALAVTITGLEHVCEQVGTPDSYGNVAVICTDLMKVDNGDGTYYGEVQTEAACENSVGTIVQCDNITVWNEGAWAAGGVTNTGGTMYGACGHSNGACPVGRYYVYGYYIPPSPATCISNAWGVTDGGVGGTTIELPQSGQNETLPADFGTPHTSIGNC